MAKVRKAVITAAGRGTRQYPASTAVQKEMFPMVDRDGLTKPRAFVVLRAPVADTDKLGEELKEHVKSRIGVWKYPRWIEFVDGLPKTATGKIQRFRLRDV